LIAYLFGIGGRILLLHALNSFPARLPPAPLHLKSTNQLLGFFLFAIYTNFASGSRARKHTHCAFFSLSGLDPKLAPIATRKTKQIDNLKQGFKTHFHDSFIFITGK
jgi:hypothetical protein